MDKKEIRIGIHDSEYVDSLIVSLVRQGYTVSYVSESCGGGSVFFEIRSENVVEIE